MGGLGVCARSKFLIPFCNVFCPFNYIMNLSFFKILPALQNSQVAIALTVSERDRESYLHQFNDTIFY